MNRRYVLSQALKTVFQCLLYASLFLTFFLLLSITNPPIINLSRTAATTMATFAIVLAILTYVYGGYQLGVRKARSVFSSILIATTLTDVVTYLQLEIMNVNPAKNRQLILFGEDFWLLCGAMLLQVGLAYLFVMLGYHFYFKINPPQRCCVITSSQEQAEHVAQKMATFRQKYKLCEVAHFACEDIFETILRHDAVFLAGIPDTEEALLKSFCYQNGKTVYLQAELEDVIIATSQQHVIDDTLFLCIRRVELSFLQRFVKRLADVVISLLGLIVTSPVMLFASLFIALGSPGPVFFRQKRATIAGRVFEIIKFRTMYVNACDAAGHSACVNDDRITKVGRVLRKYRIDELPQLFNVLLGDMSIVGPRPEMLENVDKYTQEVPEFEYRKQMKAGLTGMAQIDGKYNTTPKDKVILDLLYIENFSLMMDAKLILRTATIFFRRDSTEGFQLTRKNRCPEMRIVSGAEKSKQQGVKIATDQTALETETCSAAMDAGTESRFRIIPTEISVIRENNAMETVLDGADVFSGAVMNAAQDYTPEPKADAVADGAIAQNITAIGDGTQNQNAEAVAGEATIPAVAMPADGTTEAGVAPVQSMTMNGEAASAPNMVATADGAAVLATDADAMPPPDAEHQPSGTEMAPQPLSDGARTYATEENRDEPANSAAPETPEISAIAAPLSLCMGAEQAQAEQSHMLAERAAKKEPRLTKVAPQGAPRLEKPCAMQADDTAQQIGSVCGEPVSATGA